MLTLRWLAVKYEKKERERERETVKKKVGEGHWLQAPILQAAVRFVHVSDYSTKYRPGALRKWKKKKDCINDELFLFSMQHNNGDE